MQSTTKLCSPPPRCPCVKHELHASQFAVWFVCLSICTFFYLEWSIHKKYFLRVSFLECQLFNVVLQSTVLVLTTLVPILHCNLKIFTHIRIYQDFFESIQSNFILDQDVSWIGYKLNVAKIQWRMLRQKCFKWEYLFGVLSYE